MSFSSILVISLAAAVVLVVGGGLMMYMANLVKSAYQLKVELHGEVEDRLRQMDDNLDKKSKWIKKDALEEVAKIKQAMEAENARKFKELAEPVIKRLDEMSELLRKERREWVKAVESDRENITKLDQKIRALRRDLRRLADGEGVPTLGGEEAPGTGDAPAPPDAGDNRDATSAAADPPAEKKEDAAPPPTPPRKQPPKPGPSGKPQSVAQMLPDLGRNG